MQDYEKGDFGQALAKMAAVFNHNLRGDLGVDGYFSALERFPLTPVLLAIKDAATDEERFPVPKRLIQRIKSKFMTRAAVANEANTEWLLGKIQANHCVCGNEKNAGDPFCMPCWEVVESRGWGNEIKLVESYYLGACATLRVEGITIQDPDILPGMKGESGR